MIWKLAARAEWPNDFKSGELYLWRKYTHCTLVIGTLTE
jgi:hypothetical protein